MRIPEPFYRVTGQLHRRYQQQWKTGKRSAVLPWNTAHNAIFVHIPKTAGTSLLKVLEVNPPADFLTHVPVEVYRDHHAALWENAFKFTFVRNPEKRLASAFHFMRDATDWPPQVRWAEKHLKGLEFAEFLQRMERNFLYRQVVMSNPFFWPQSDYLRLGRGYATLDQIYYFEDLEAGAEDVCKRLNLPWTGLPHERKSTGRPNKVILEERAKALIHKLYQKDFEMFGYEPEM